MADPSFEPGEWWKLSLDIRRRWWKETNYGEISPSPELVLLIREKLSPPIAIIAVNEEDTP